MSQPEDSVGPVQVIVFDQFRERSTGLAACPNDVTLLDGNEFPFPDQGAIPPGSTVKIRLTPRAQNVLNINSATLNHISTLTSPDTDDGGRDGDADAGGAPQGHKHEKHATYEDEHENPTLHGLA
ncbi:hypothetical protein [Nonomuraea sp. 10N515B]|uniref:hypothetical protein n=1 Tax=Nonomuraea sp. 10N515B TaxID=3457422 RepID=UPI003FCD6B8D